METVFSSNALRSAKPRLLKGGLGVSVLRVDKDKNKTVSNACLTSIYSALGGLFSEVHRYPLAGFTQKD